MAAYTKRLISHDPRGARRANEETDAVGTGSVFFKVVVAFFSYEASFCSTFSGFNVTAPSGLQFRVLLDHRSGCFALASS